MATTDYETPTGPGGATPGPVGVLPRQHPISAPPAAKPAKPRPPVGTALGLGTAVLYLSLIVLIPLAAVVLRSGKQGGDYFWRAVTTPDAWAALKLTVGGAAVVAIINLVMGTVIAWVLVRDKFPGKAVVDTLIDLPFALPTIVAGLVLLALYGTQ